MKPQLNVIVVEDNPLDARLMVRELERAGYRVQARIVDSEATFHQALDAPHDIILVDYTLPSYDALQVLREVQRRGLDVPVILVAGSVDEERALACLRAGCDDYLLKDRLARLGWSVEQALQRRGQQLKMRLMREKEGATERRLSAMLDLGREAGVLLDASGRILFSTGVRSLGYRDGETVGLTMKDVVHPDHLESVVRAVQALVEGGGGAEHCGEYLSRAKDGSYRCLAVRAVNRFDDADIKGILVNLRDVTDEKASRFALEESERRYRALFEATRSIICTHTLGGTILEVNGAALALIGQSPGEMVGRSLSDYFLPSNGGLAVHRSRDGVDRWMLAESHAHAHGGNGPVITTQYTDVTAQLEARNELRRQTELLRTVVDAIVTYMRTSELTAACRGVIEGVTQLGEGLRCGLLIRRDEHWEAVGDDTLCDVESVLALAAGHSSDAPIRMDGRSILPVTVGDQQVAWIVIEGTYRDSLDSLAQTVGLLYDVERRKRQEERLQIELRQSQKLEAVGRLVGGIAHDFNNLLTAIMGFVERAREAVGVDHVAADDLAQAQQSAVRAERLTRQLLTFSQRQPIAPPTLELQATMADLGLIFDRILGEDIDVRMTLSDTPMLVSGAIEQLVVGLAVRVREALPRGGRLLLTTSEIELRSADTRRSGTFAVVSVICQGTEGQVLHGFSGLLDGLATGHGSGRPADLDLFSGVEQAGGWLDVDALGADGVTVRIYLPRCEAGVSPAAALAAKGQPRVLLVEDEDMVRRLVRVMLEDAGFEVIDSSSGADAVRLVDQAEAASLDLLITDVVMPGMNGRELATRMMTSNPAMKVIFISGYTEDAVVRDGVRDDDIAFLQKPFTRQRFLHKVREIMAS